MPNGAAQVHALLQEGKLVVLVKAGSAAAESLDSLPVRTVVVDSLAPYISSSSSSSTPLLLVLLSPTGAVLAQTSSTSDMLRELRALATLLHTARQPARARLAITSHSASPAQVLEFEDASRTTFADVLHALLVLGDDDEKQRLTCRFPKRDFTLEEHGTRTLEELGLVGSVALVRGGSRRGALQQQQQWTVLVWLLALWAWLVGLFSGGGVVAAPAPVAQPPNQKKKNEYWNGDSTVFESPEDDKED